MRSCTGYSGTLTIVGPHGIARRARVEVWRDASRRRSLCGELTADIPCLPVRVCLCACDEL